MTAVAYQSLSIAPLETLAPKQRIEEINKLREKHASQAAIVEILDLAGKVQGIFDEMTPYLAAISASKPKAGMLMALTAPFTGAPPSATEALSEDFFKNQIKPAWEKLQEALTLSTQLRGRIKILRDLKHAINSAAKLKGSGSFNDSCDIAILKGMHTAFNDHIYLPCAAPCDRHCTEIYQIYITLAPYVKITPEICPWYESAGRAVTTKMNGTAGTSRIRFIGRYLPEPQCIKDSLEKFHSNPLEMETQAIDALWLDLLGLVYKRPERAQELQKDLDAIRKYRNDLYLSTERENETDRSFPRDLSRLDLATETQLDTYRAFLVTELHRAPPNRKGAIGKKIKEVDNAYLKINPHLQRNIAYYNKLDSETLAIEKGELLEESTRVKSALRERYRARIRDVESVFMMRRLQEIYHGNRQYPVVVDENFKQFQTLLQHYYDNYRDGRQMVEAGIAVLKAIADYRDEVYLENLERSVAMINTLGCLATYEKQGSPITTIVEKLSRHLYAMISKQMSQGKPETLKDLGTWHSRLYWQVKYHLPRCEAEIDRLINELVEHATSFIRDEISKISATTHQEYIEVAVRISNFLHVKEMQEISDAFTLRYLDHVEPLLASCAPSLAQDIYYGVSSASTYTSKAHHPRIRALTAMARFLCKHQQNTSCLVNMVKEIAATPTVVNPMKCYEVLCALSKKCFDRYLSEMTEVQSLNAFNQVVENLNAFLFVHPESKTSADETRHAFVIEKRDQIVGAFHLPDIPESKPDQQYEIAKSLAVASSCKKIEDHINKILGKFFEMATHFLKMRKVTVADLLQWQATLKDIATFTPMAKSQATPLLDQIAERLQQ